MANPRQLLGVLVSLGCAVLGVTAGGCAPPSTVSPTAFPFTIVVEGDPGRAVEGVSITRGEKVLASTNAQGTATLSLRGTDGESVDVEVKCPAQFRSPTKPLTLRLAHVSGNKVPELRASCLPTSRRVVVAVRAEHGPNIPVKYLDQEVARTDASGAATFFVDVAAGSQFNVTLDTSESDGLRPRSPAHPFIANDTGFVVLNQSFSVEKKVILAKKKTKIRCLSCG